MFVLKFTCDKITVICHVLGGNKKFKTKFVTEDKARMVCGIDR